MFLLGHSDIVQREGAATALALSYHSLTPWGFGRPVLYDRLVPKPNPDLAHRLDDLVVSAVDGSAHDVIGLAQHLRPFDLVRRLVEPGRRVIHVESTPPSALDAGFAEEMGMMPYAPGPRLAPSPVRLRYKQWRLHSAIVREACGAAGVEFLPYPQGPVNEGCYLRPELYHRPCHANAADGELVFRQLGSGL